MVQNMTANVSLPEGYHTVTPFLVVNDANNFIDFLKNAFDAKEICRYNQGNDLVLHAEVQIGDSRIMLSDAPEESNPMTYTLYVYVDDVDNIYQKALNAGANSLREPTDEFYGDRRAGVLDPFSNQWWIATRKEDISEEELKNRMQEYTKMIQESFSLVTN